MNDDERQRLAMMDAILRHMALTGHALGYYWFNKDVVLYIQNPIQYAG